MSRQPLIIALKISPWQEGLKARVSWVIYLTMPKLSVIIESMLTANSQATFEEAKEAFISHWGSMGSSWGINRTMAQIHALLMISLEPLSTDEVMAELSISRGNANTNLRELVNWGLVYLVTVRGERKDYFEAEKDAWRMFCVISRERKRREIEPAIGVLGTCLECAREDHTAQAQEFVRVLGDLAQFLNSASQLMEALARQERSHILPLAAKMLGGSKEFR